MQTRSPAVSGQSQSATVVEIFPGATLRPRVPPIRMPARLTTAKGALDFRSRWEAKLYRETEALMVQEQDEIATICELAKERVAERRWKQRIEDRVYATLIQRRRKRGPMRPTRAGKAATPSESNRLSDEQVAVLGAQLRSQLVSEGLVT